MCNGCLYTRSVIHFTEEKYPVVEEDLFYANVTSLDDCEYICVTCDKHLKKNKIPYQAFYNILEMYQLPN